MNVCSIEGCPDNCFGRGWCLKHYTRWRRHGDPLSVTQRGSTAAERAMSPAELFWTRVDKDVEAPCWKWTLAPMRKGYGRFHIAGSTGSVYAHRMAYELTKGPIPDGHEIHHQCENKLCVNPDHLEPLTIAAHRALGWGRTHCPRGHEYTEPNTYVNPKGVKVCRTCHFRGPKREATT